MTRIIILIFLRLTISWTPKFYRQILELSDVAIAEGKMPIHGVNSNRKLTSSGRRNRSYGSIIETLKQRQHKRELIAMVDDMAHGPGFHSKRHTTDEYIQKPSFRVPPRKRSGRYKFFINHHMN